MSNPFRYFNSSPEVIRLVVMMYVRYPLSLRNVEDLLAERGIDISHETVRFWWNRFGPMFAAEIRKRRAVHMRSCPQWRWHLDEVFVKVNGKLCYLWRAVDHEGEVFGGRGHREAGQGRGAETSQADHKEKYESTRSIVTDRLRGYSAAMNDIGVAAERHEVGGRLRRYAQRIGISRCRTVRQMGDAAFSKYEDAAEIQLSSRPGPQPIQSGAPSRHPADLQTETLGRISGVARPCGVDRHLKEGMCPKIDEPSLL